MELVETGWVCLTIGLVFFCDLLVLEFCFDWLLVFEGLLFIFEIVFDELVLLGFVFVWEFVFEDVDGLLTVDLVLLFCLLLTLLFIELLEVFVVWVLLLE